MTVHGDKGTPPSIWGSTENPSATGYPQNCEHVMLLSTDFPDTFNVAQKLGGYTLVIYEKKWTKRNLSYTLLLTSHWAVTQSILGPLYTESSITRQVWSHWLSVKGHAVHSTSNSDWSSTVMTIRNIHPSLAFRTMKTSLGTLHLPLSFSFLEWPNTWIALRHFIFLFR